MHPADVPPNPVEKPGYRLEFQDEFDGPALDAAKWLPFYLPHWSSRQLARPNYTFREGCLVLQITADQPPWCPEFDGEVRASSIQTGQFSGPLGSATGQHHFHPALRVREEQENAQTYLPRGGYFELRARALRSRRNHVALWMIGYEDVPEHSGEIAVFEIMGAHMDGASSRIGHGVRRWGDPRLRDEFYEPYLPFDAAAFHIYALEWTPTQLDFYLDNQKIRTVYQSPQYPMQFFLSIYELPGEDDGTAYPKEFAVDYFRAYQPEGG